MKHTLRTFLASAILLSIPAASFAQSPAIGVSGSFALFTTTGAITNTGTSQVTGNVGANTGAGTNFGNVNGTMHSNNGTTAAAATDLTNLYNQLNGATPTDTLGLLLGNGDTLLPGIYFVPANATLSDTLVLDGNANAASPFIFQVQGTLSSITAATVVLTNGAVACNVYWKVEGLVSLVANTTMRGTIVASNASIVLGSNVVLDGRALSTTGAISVNNVSIKVPVGCGSPMLTGPAAPALLSTACYALFTGNGAMSNAGITTTTGDVGTNVTLTTGFDSMYVTGAIHPVPDASTNTAATDLLTVYNYLNLLPHDIELLYPAQFGNNLVLTPHTYLLTGAAALTGTLTLNGEGNPNAVFVIKISGALTTSTFATVVLSNGTQAKNVFWKVDGAVQMSDYSVMKGTFIVNNAAVSMNTGASLEGRALTTNGAFSTAAVTAQIPAGTCANIIALPMGWLSFTAKAQKGASRLAWSIAGNTAGSQFIVERADDAKHFTTIGSLNGVAASNGDAQYSFTDASPHPDNYYRITQLQTSRGNKVSATLYLRMAASAGAQISSYAKNGNIYLRMSGVSAGSAHVTLLGSDGRRISTGQLQLSAGAASYEMPAPAQPGIYLLQVEQNGQRLYTGKVGI